MLVIFGERLSHLEEEEFVLLLLYKDHWDF